MLLQQFVKYIKQREGSMVEITKKKKCPKKNRNDGKSHDSSNLTKKSFISLEIIFS
jgi:hypothetical protein